MASLYIASCHLQTVTFFTSSFPIWIPFFFSSLIAVAWISKTVLNNSGESEHPCLIPDLRRTHGFAHLSKMPDLFRVAS